MTSQLALTVIPALNAIVNSGLSAAKKSEVLVRAENKFKQSKEAFEAVYDNRRFKVHPCDGFTKLDEVLSKKIAAVSNSGTQLAEILPGLLTAMKLSLDPAAACTTVAGAASSESTTDSKTLDFSKLEKGTLVVPTEVRHIHNYPLGLPCAYAGNRASNPEWNGSSKTEYDDYFVQWGSEDGKLGNHLPKYLSCIRAATMEECIAWVMLHEIIFVQKQQQQQ